MKQISLPLSLSLVVVALIVGVVIGFFVSPEYQSRMYDKTEMGLGTPDRWLDLRYVDKMIAHHRGAILVAEQAKKYSQRKEIQDLASEILSNEPKAIDELYSWKKAWYGNERQVKDPIIPNLGTYDEQFDLRFLNAVLGHHADGVLMTQEVRKKTARKEILNNADTVETFLKGSIKMLEEWRKNWYFNQ